MEWTDDMSVRLVRGATVSSLVSYVLAAKTDRAPRRDVLGVLTETFGLSFDDARLALDRVDDGIVRAQSGNAANEPDLIKDPIAWTSYRMELGEPVRDESRIEGFEVVEAAEALLERARSGERTQGTDDVAVAIEVAGIAVASSEPGPIRYRLLLEAATSVSVAAEATIDRLDGQRCAPAGSQEWVDGIALASAARQLTATFAAQPDPQLEEQGLGLVGRIVTRLLGQCHAFVGQAMVESARCIERNSNPELAASHVEPVLSDFEVVLDWFSDDAPFDEHVIALEYLLAAIDLIVKVRGNSAELDAIRTRTVETLGRAIQP